MIDRYDQVRSDQIAVEEDVTSLDPQPAGCLAACLPGWLTGFPLRLYTSPARERELQAGMEAREGRVTSACLDALLHLGGLGFTSLLPAATNFTFALCFSRTNWTFRLRFYRFAHIFFPAHPYADIRLLNKCIRIFWFDICTP